MNAIAYREKNGKRAVSLKPVEFIQDGDYQHVHSYQFVSLTPEEFTKIASATVGEVDAILRKFLH